MKRYSLPIALTLSLCACTTEPRYPESELVLEPLFTDQLQSALQERIDSSYCRINSCSSLRSDPHHYICTGAYSFMSPSEALRYFEPVLKTAHQPATQIDFTADEGTDSQLLSTFTLALLIGAAGSHDCCSLMVHSSSPQIHLTLISEMPREPQTSSGP